MMIDAVGEVELEETKVGSQSVFVQGKLKFSVLYRGESGEKRSSSLQGEIPFREKINMDGVERTGSGNSPGGGCGSGNQA